MTQMRRTRDDGFTLIEMLISISITVIILSSISAALLVFLSNGKYTLKRDDHSAGAVLLSSYLDRDLASATAAAPPVTPPAACAAATTVLSLSWRDYTATAVAPMPAPGDFYVSRYVVSSDVADDLGDAGCKLSRIYGRGPSLTSLTTISAEVLVRNMPPGAFTATTGAGAGTCGIGSPVSATLLQYSTDTAGNNYTYRGCVRGRQNP